MPRVVPLILAPPPPLLPIPGALLLPRPDRLRERHVVRFPAHLRQPHLRGVLRDTRRLPEEVVREPKIERHRFLDALHVLLAQLQRERLDVLPQVVDVAAAHDGEDVGTLVHDVRERDARNDGALLVRDILENPADLDSCVGGGYLPALLGLALLLRLEGAASKGAPGGEGHPLTAGHGDDVPLEVALGGRPAALVNRELREAVVTSVFVCFAVSGQDRVLVEGSSVPHLTTQAGVSLMPR